ncbi:hypothetical protein [Sphingobacterium yanglingense]|uniref:Uncharacterized protein n=1 Tax=Sphingobacterium yanglingense TaxID=1437280 RepID=A0A4R6WMZ9_9SPHI|nr:hypothetical protein [Sphingobacterium yanglingense]TDQ79461.1 hypothetical protein CLV99_0899 [Sphingobacterium yanglingense]
MKTSEIMKTKFNKFWKGIAVAAVLSATAVGYAEASKLQTATHYNAEADPEKAPRWEPIVPGGQGSLACTLNPDRDCKAIELPNGDFQVVQKGNYPGL